MCIKCYITQLKIYFPLVSKVSQYNIDDKVKQNQIATKSLS